MGDEYETLTELEAGGPLMLQAPPEVLRRHAIDARQLKPESDSPAESGYIDYVVSHVIDGAVATPRANVGAWGIRLRAQRPRRLPARSGTGSGSTPW